MEFQRNMVVGGDSDWLPRISWNEGYLVADGCTSTSTLSESLPYVTRIYLARCGQEVELAWNGMSQWVKLIYRIKLSG